MGLSVLLHLLVLWLAYRFPSTVRPPEEVMEIDLSDIPRATDFLPGERGILEGRPPRPAPPPPARKEIPLPPVMQGRVPDLPVKQDLPPEESFPVNARKAEPSGEAKGAQGKDAGGREAKAEPSPVTPRSTPGKSSSPRSSPSKSLRDLTPSLGKMVMAREEPSGGRGQGAAAGNAVGTGGKSTGEEGVTEEGGGGFRLTPLNAPEVQYISYFASIKRKIELVWQYPYEAAAAGIQGELTLDFVIARSGAVNSIELVRGSGSKILDDEAIRSIRKAAPFDPIPAQYKIPSLQIRGRFVYVHGGSLRLLR
jgi:protein TonB